MHIRPFHALYPKLKYITSSDSFFGSVKQDYPDYKRAGIFEKTEQEGFYLYSIKSPRKQYNGLIATSDINDYLDGSILKHEQTLTSLEQVQLDLLFRRGATVKPVLLTYDTVDSIEEWYETFMHRNEPFFELDFEEEGQHHKIWSINKAEDISELQTLFLNNIPKTYIADGHHRSSTAALMYERNKHKDPERYRYFLTAYFSFRDLEVLDFNRVIRDLGNNSLSSFMAHLSKVCEIKPLKKESKPKRKHELTMLVNKEWYRLRWRKKALKGIEDPASLLDASLLEHLVLDPILGIDDARTDKRIKYVEGVKGMDNITNIVNRGHQRVGFFLYPVEMEDFTFIADAGSTMPPKSTWFEPRMKNGIIVQEL
ncbi:MAG: DUF1015 family protein [Saprospiraceae bacterium]